MNEKDVLKVFKSEKALLTGHFLLSSGLHSSNYMQCALLFQKPWIAETLCVALAKKLKAIKVDTVIGAALGGVIVSYEMGRALHVRSLFAERLPAGQAGIAGALVLRRGFSLKKNERVLIVEDVVTTGKSTREVIEIVKQQGAKLAAVASIVDRSAGAAIFGTNFFSLLKINIKIYQPDACPLCHKGTSPVVKPGSRGLQNQGK